VLWRRQITVATLGPFLRAGVAAYPRRTPIDLGLANWPVHVDPDRLAAVAPQPCPGSLPHPPHWLPEPSAAARRTGGARHRPIHRVPLPTYASWLHPVDKLWRQRRHDVGHLHPRADDLPALQAAVDRFLARFADGAADLLRDTGRFVPHSFVNRHQPTSVTQPED
jgi:hypothetical protein